MVPGRVGVAGRHYSFGGFWHFCFSWGWDLPWAGLGRIW